MYAARIEIGWVNKWFEGETPCEIISNVEEYQDFGCLMMMGRSNEKKKGQKELDKLQIFLDKYYSRTLTIDDIRDLKIHLSIADIVCHEVKEIDEVEI